MCLLWEEHLPPTTQQLQWLFEILIPQMTKQHSPRRLNIADVLLWGRNYAPKYMDKCVVMVVPACLSPGLHSPCTAVPSRALQAPALLQSCLLGMNSVYGRLGPPAACQSYAAVCVGREPVSPALCCSLTWQPSPRVPVTLSITPTLFSAGVPSAQTCSRVLSKLFCSSCLAPWTQGQLPGLGRAGGNLVSLSEFPLSFWVPSLSVPAFG